MAGKITTRKLFKDYILRKVGAPVLLIDMDEDQINDRVDEALKKFWMYHYDGKERIYYVHKVAQEDVSRKYIKLPPNINGVVKIFPISSAFNVGSVFSLQYQIVLQDMWRWSSVQMTNYYMIYQYTQMMEELLVGSQPIRFNELNNRLYVDMDWTKIPVGNYMIAEAFRILNPDQLTLCLDNLSGTFIEGETVTGGTSGTTGTIKAINKQTQQELFVEDWSTDFEEGETITGGTSGATATLAIQFDCEDVWNHQWLQNYAAALIEEQWGINLTKFTNVTMPGGHILNGEGILARGTQNKLSLENELYSTYNQIPMDYIG